MNLLATPHEYFNEHTSKHLVPILYTMPSLYHIFYVCLFQFESNDLLGWNVSFINSIFEQCCFFSSSFFQICFALLTPEIAVGTLAFEAPLLAWPIKRLKSIPLYYDYVSRQTEALEVDIEFMLDFRSSCNILMYVCIYYRHTILYIYA